MKSVRLSKNLPCNLFFSEGEFVMGLVVLLLQLTIVLWPVAAHLARRREEQKGVEKLLAELSEAHYLAADPYATAPKRFRSGRDLHSAITL